MIRNKTEGFASLDAIIAVIIMMLAFTGVVSWMGALRISSLKNGAQFEEFLFKMETEKTSWQYSSE